MTKDYVFLIHLNGFSKRHTPLRKAEEEAIQNTLEYLEKNLEWSDIKTIEKFLLEKLNPESVYKVNELEKIVVNVSFWVFGKVEIKPAGEKTMLITIKTKEKRQEIKDFYLI